MKEKITRTEFNGWLENPITLEIMKELRGLRENHISHLLNGVPGDSSQDVIYRIGEATGRINAYDDLLLIQYDDIAVLNEGDSDEI